MQFSFEKPNNPNDKATPVQELGITESTPVWVAVPETNSHEFFVGEELRLVEDDGTSEPYFRSVKRPRETWYVLLDEITLVEPTPAFFGWDVWDWGEDSEGTLVQLVSSREPAFLQFKDGRLYSPLRVELDLCKLKRFPKLPRVFQIPVDTSTHSELLKHEHLEYVRGKWMSGARFDQFQPCVIGNYFLCFDGDSWHWEHDSNVYEGSVTIMLSQFTQWLTHRHRSVTFDKQAPEPAPEQAPEYNTPTQARGISVGTTVWFTGTGHHWLQYGDELVLSEDDGSSFPFFTCTNRGPAHYERCAHLSDVSLINPNKVETPLQQAGLEVGSVCILKEDYTNNLGDLVLRKHSAVVVVQDDGSEKPSCCTLRPAISLFGGNRIFPDVYLLQDTGLKHDVESI